MMSVQELPTRSEVEAQINEWIDRTWTEDVTVRHWWAAMAAARYASPSLPVEAGGLGWPHDLSSMVLTTMTRRRVLGPPGGLGLLLAAPTIATHGTAAQIERYLPPILDGTQGWCQLFSEPQAGSDLAGLQTRAERDGDEWVVTGQKVWTSTAQTADLAILIARTDPDAPKHKGISYFIIDMRQPGIEVRPLREMTGRAVFNEVFLDEARVPAANLLGDLGEGWRIANTTLGFERAGAGHGGATFSAALPGAHAGDLDKSALSFVGAKGPINGAAVGRRHLRALSELAVAADKVDDAVARQAITRVHINHRIQQMMGWKAKNRPGSRTGVEGNLAKVYNSGAVANGRDAANHLLGPVGQLWESEGSAGVFQEMTVFSPAPPIYAGSDQIQRNVIGERGLGLPREPGPDRDTPFSQLPNN
ncbi:MAG: alkylation response protein AidB-like acyl-CoA dehydrogenase [Candidatus Poriferisodalaceae bacterium]|jgi:alkylation response protein AidB-like acyl-CoA dehydrogenase